MTLRCNAAVTVPGKGMPAGWREFSWFRIGLPVRIQRWPARLGKFKARLTLTGPKVTSRNPGHAASVDGPASQGGIAPRASESTHALWALVATGAWRHSERILIDLFGRNHRVASVPRFFARHAEWSSEGTSWNASLCPACRRRHV